MNAYSAGVYWTHIGPAGWYTDAVMLGSAPTLDNVSKLMCTWAGVITFTNAGQFTVDVP